MKDLTFDRLDEESEALEEEAMTAVGRRRRSSKFCQNFEGIDIDFSFSIMVIFLVVLYQVHFYAKVEIKILLFYVDYCKNCILSFV